jgi:hypothetical protein
VREEFYQDHNIQKKRNFKCFNDHLIKLFYSFLLPIYCAIPHASSALRFIDIIYSSEEEEFTNRFFYSLFTTMSSTRSGSTRTAAAALLRVPGGNGGGGGYGGGDGGGPPPAPNGVVLPNDFGLTPTQVAPAWYIRYSEATGIKLWNAASATLPANWAVDSEGLSRFNEHVVDREMQSGWNATGASIMMIPDVDGVLRQLVHNYGQLTQEDVSMFVATFIGQDTRQAQNDVQFYYCIANTLDERGHLRMVSEAESYTM